MSDDNGRGTNGSGTDPGGEAIEAIAQLFDDYQTGFNDFEAERIADCFALPAIIWQHEKGHVFSDEEELLENIEVLLAALEKEGVTYSDFHVSSSHVSGTTALVTLDWQQENDDGDAVLEFTCHYHLIQDGDDWAIAMVVNE
ncbi:DUF4440 domain-containing protein [uncultured Roseibium sp.]|uniref:DUF4440 domain-containing protein n=1 Tax=uncultured Roseibium sp. TaxID=1936171 RepID=UPI0032167B0F